MFQRILVNFHPCHILVLACGPDSYRPNRPHSVLTCPGSLFFKLRPTRTKTIRVWLFFRPSLARRAALKTARAGPRPTLHISENSSTSL
jgi:hypothetical protein